MTEKRSVLLLIMDGAGDRLVPELGNKTPFQAAKTPTMDRLAKEGQSGLMHVIAPGITPGSDTAHLSLFGYDPEKTYPGRGPLEALGAGLDSRPGDVAFRANFATVDKDFIVQDRRAGRDFTEEEGRILQDVVNSIELDGAIIKFVHTVQHRGAIVLRGEGLSGEITDNDPHETGTKVLDSTPLVDNEAARKTAGLVNQLVKLTYEAMKGLEVNEERKKRGLPPANVLLLRGAGQHQEIESLEHRYGIKSAVIAGGALYIGTAKYVGMDHLTVEGQTGTIETNFDNIADKVVECVESGYDLVFVHIKATDNASHDGNVEEKVEAIEKTDGMLGRITSRVGDRLVVAATADHTTPLSVGEHMCDPVPVLLWSDFIRPDDVSAFSEIDAAQGALHTIRGTDLFPMLLGYASLTEKYGA